ncbi:MAG TPA: hypothetical protein VL026_02615 [Rhizomicrobium sp.]|nr:hypothetical protein [Rhizomicrobium sp.]
MSELIQNERSAQLDLRSILLSSVAALAVVAFMCSESAAAQAGEGENQPTVWVELGGQLQRMSGQDKYFSPKFLDDYAGSPGLSPTKPGSALTLPHYGKGFEGKITLAPQDSDWRLSGSIVYGRSNGKTHMHQSAIKTIPTGYYYHGNPLRDPLGAKQFSDVETKSSSSYMLIDFKVGKDVGLGAVGRDATSTLSFGLRTAVFTAKADANIKARPEIHLHGFLPNKYWTNFYASAQTERSFRGIGPSLSWDGSAAVLGSAENGLSLDWGLSGAVLFGRQKVDTRHQTSAREMYSYFYFNYSEGYKNAPPRKARKHSVVVPNLGGFVGASLRRANAKVSIGYRGDFFFGAMDTGLDSRKAANTSFHGPFATISIGLGG